MSFLKQWLDPACRFERRYAEYLVTRFQGIPWPGGTRVELIRSFVPIRGLDAELASHPRLVLTGGSGDGKTTTLACLALAHAQALLAGKPGALVPIFLSARDFSPESLPPRGDLRHALNLSDTLVAECPPTYFADAIGAQRALVLIDDIDALPSGAVEGWLAEFGQARLLATSAAALPHLPEFALPGFRDGDINAFAKAWSAEQAHAFVAALKSSRVPRTLTANPLTLTLLSRVFRPDEALPARRTLLFDAYAQQILKDLTGETAQMLEGVALATMRGSPAVNGFTAKSHGFLRVGRNRRAEFCHDLWQAYFAARAVRQSPDLAPVSEMMSDPRWQETVVFYGSLGDATELVQTLGARGDWALAGRVLAHAGGVRPELRDSVTQELLRRAWDGDSLAIAALAEMGSDVAVEHFGARLKDPDPAVRARAAQVLGQLRLDRGIEFLLPALRDAKGEVRDKVLEALGCARTDRVIEPLLVALRGDPRGGRVDTSLRIAAAKALGQVGSDKAVTALIVDLQIGEPEVRAVAAEALKRITSPLMRKPLAAMLQSHDEETRRYAQEILGNLGFMI